MERQAYNGAKLFFRDRGEGTPLVLLHGWSMSGRFFDRQLAPLSERFRVLVPDFRGHGESEKPLSGHTVDQYARDIAELLDELDIERPVLLGWSMGVMVAYAYLQQRGQEQVRGLIVVEQVPSDFAYPDNPYSVFDLAAVQHINQQLQSDQVALAGSFAESMVHAPAGDSCQWMAQEMMKVPPAIASAILVDQTLRDDRLFIPKISIPTLVIFGADPSLTNPDAGRWISEQIKGSQLLTIEEASHCPFYEQADQFNEAVAEFAAPLR
jgi:non-heme chloroperoxidase